MLVGEYHHNIDKKGRLTLPSKFREELGKEIYVTRGLENCLMIFTANKFKELSLKLNKIPFTKKSARNFSRFFLSGATASEFDSQGRINITSPLINHANLTKECVVIGVGDYIEIWSEEKWLNFYNSSLEEMSDLAENLLFGDDDE